MKDMDKLKEAIQKFLTDEMTVFFAGIKKVKKFVFEDKEYYWIRKHTGEEYILVGFIVNENIMELKEEIDCNPFHKRIPTHLKKPVDQNVKHICKNYEKVYNLFSKLFS